MNDKKLMRALRLCVTREVCLRSNSPIAELHLAEIAEAERAIAEVRATALIPHLAALITGGVPLQLDLSPKVRSINEKSHGRGDMPSLIGSGTIK